MVVCVRVKKRRERACVCVCVCESVNKKAQIILFSITYLYCFLWKKSNLNVNCINVYTCIILNEIKKQLNHKKMCKVKGKVVLIREIRQFSNALCNIL